MSSAVTPILSQFKDMKLRVLAKKCGFFIQQSISRFQDFFVFLTRLRIKMILNSYERYIGIN